MLALIPFNATRCEPTRKVGVKSSPQDWTEGPSRYNVAEQASSARYLQATLEKRFQLVEEKANLQARLERIAQTSDAAEV